MMTASTNLAAQKPLTLEHLLGGGNQYHQMVPENKHLTWWGNTALETRAEEVADADGGKVLFSIEDLNQWAGKKIAYSGHNTRFPYEGEPLVLVTGARERTLIDFTRHTVKWTQSIPEGAANQDWNPQSRNLAYTVKGNLYVQTADGKTLQVTTDGSTDGSDNIVYGTSVHRNEWGIEKGTFWSPDGKKLAFYRMDQSMVPSYPQVDITTRIATTYTDHYPMAGERSHEVKVGIYDVETGTTTWMDLVGEKEDYHTNLSWAPDGKTLYVFELNRRQNHMRLMAYDPYCSAEDMETQGAVCCQELSELLSNSDIVTIHTPLNDETRGLLGLEQLRQMKPTALLINCARGGIVDEAALIRALEEGTIAGAGIDVTVEEPLRAENPLCSAPNLIISPHSAAQTREATVRAATMCAEGCIAVLHGQRWPAVANPEVYLHPRWNA